MQTLQVTKEVNRKCTSCWTVLSHDDNLEPKNKTANLKHQMDFFLFQNIGDSFQTSNCAKETFEKKEAKKHSTDDWANLPSHSKHVSKNFGAASGASFQPDFHPASCWCEGWGPSPPCGKLRPRNRCRVPIKLATGAASFSKDADWSCRTLTGYQPFWIQLNLSIPAEKARWVWSNHRLEQSLSLSQHFVKESKNYPKKKINKQWRRVKAWKYNCFIAKLQHCGCVLMTPHKLDLSE